MALSSSSIGQGSPVCLDVAGNGIDCGMADTSSTCFDGAGDEVDCSSYSSAALPTSPITSPVNSLGAASAATGISGGGAAPSTSPLGIFSSLATSAATAFAASQGTTTAPKPVGTLSGISLGGSSGTLLLLVAAAAIAFFAFGGKKALK